MPNRFLSNIEIYRELYKLLDISEDDSDGSNEDFDKLEDIESFQTPVYAELKLIAQLIADQYDECDERNSENESDSAKECDQYADAVEQDGVLDVAAIGKDLGIPDDIESDVAPARNIEAASNVGLGRSRGRGQDTGVSEQQQVEEQTPEIEWAQLDVYKETRVRNSQVCSISNGTDTLCKKKCIRQCFLGIFTYVLFINDRFNCTVHKPESD